MALCCRRYQASASESAATAAQLAAVTHVAAQRQEAIVQLTGVLDSAKSESAVLGLQVGSIGA